MTEFRALAYADVRGAVNTLRTIRRSPGRLALWLLYAGAIGFFIVSRVLGPHRVQVRDVSRADYLIAFMLGFLLVTFAIGRSASGLFRSRAEAYFIIASPVRAPSAAAYLLVRDSLAQASRVLTSSLYALFLFVPRSVGPWQLIADLVLVSAILVAGFAAIVPRALLREPWSAIAAWTAGALAVVAALPAVRDATLAFAGRAPVSLAAPYARAWLPAWHPGTILLEPNGGWLVAALFAAAVATMWLAASARDAYPELFALSLARIEQRARFAARRGSAAGTGELPQANAKRRVPSRGDAPPGVLVFVWKSYLEFRRSASPRVTVAIVAALLAGGFGFARVARTDDGSLFATALSTLVFVEITLSTVAARALTAELCRPTFWLSPAWLIERLAALAVSRWWKAAACAVLAGIGFAAGGGTPAESIVLLAGLPTLFFVITAVGFASYTLLPNDLDQRGPLALARVTLSFVLAVPPVIALAVPALAFNAPLPGVVASCFVGIVESYGLLAFAAWRLDGRIDRLTAS